MSKRTYICMTLALVTLILAGCIGEGRNELTRQTAADLIQRSAKFSQKYQVISLHPQGYEKGTKQGMWHPIGEAWRSTSKLSEIAKAVFAEVSSGSLTLHEPVPIRVAAILGIADSLSGAGMKEAQFRWEYVNLSSLAKRFVVGGGTGTAQFRLYDDGWRVEDITLREAAEPVTLTTAEQKQEQADEQAETERREAEQRQRALEAAKRKAEAERLARLVAESKTSTKELGRYPYTPCPGRSGKLATGTIILSDVAIQLDASAACSTDKSVKSIFFYDMVAGKKLPLSESLFHSPTKIINIFGITRRGEAPWETPMTFLDERERDEFFTNLIRALEAWEERFPELTKQTR